MYRSSPAKDGRTRPLPRTAIHVGVAVLLAAHWLLGVSSVRYKCTTFDEMAHLTDGVAIWRTGDYRLFPPHPPLVHLWAAGPVAFSGFVMPNLNQPAWWSSDAYLVGRQFFYECGNDPQAILIRGRAMIALLSAGLGFVVWMWSRRLFGEISGLISLVFYAFDPTVLAHGRLVTTDLAASLFFLLAAGAFWRMLHRVNPQNVLLSALAVTGLLLSKMSAPIILPLMGVLAVIRLIRGSPTTVTWGRTWLIRPRPEQVGVWLLAGIAQALIIWVLIWGAYGFRYAAMRDVQPGRDSFYEPDHLPAGQSVWDHELRGMGTVGAIISWARDRKLLPEGYLFGLAFTLRHAEARDAFLNGQTSTVGWWYFFPYCFAVKTPLPLFGMLLVAAAVQARTSGGTAGRPRAPNRRWVPIAEGFYWTAPLWALVAVYLCVAMRSNLNIGHRHILPIYPALFILAGRAAVWLRAGFLLKRLVPLALAAMLVGSSLLIWPDYLAYFNVLVGGPRNGYKHLIDADWGQDLPGLKRWLDRHGMRARATGPSAETHPVYLSYCGTGLPSHYGIRARMLPGYPCWEALWPSELTGGVYCISASMLQQVFPLPTSRWTPALEASYQDLGRRLTRAGYGSGTRPAESPSAARPTPSDMNLYLILRFARLCAFLRQRTPVDQVGYTILVYRLSDDDLRVALGVKPAELVPDQQAILSRLADQCFAQGACAAAAVYYEHLLKEGHALAHQTRTRAFANWGTALMAQHRTAEAISVLQHGLEHDPSDIRMNRNLAAAYAEVGQFEDACRQAEKALTLANQRGLADLARQIAGRLELYRAGKPYRDP